MKQSLVKMIIDGRVRKRLSTKISAAKARDRCIMARNILNSTSETIKLKDGIELIQNLPNDLCTGCGDKMLFCNWEPSCVHQFTLDRIDNSQIHSINNLRIVCYNCNCCGDGSIKYPCKGDCHVNSGRNRESDWAALGRTRWNDPQFVESWDNVKS